MRISDWSSDVCSSDLTVVFTVTDSTGRTASAVHQITVSQPAIVPDLVGLELDDAADVVHGADPALRLGKVVVRSHPTIAADIVLEQHPPAGAATEVDTAVQLTSSEERRVGKECVSTCSSRESLNH